MTELHDLPAHDLIAAYRQRKLSPVEVTQAVLAHIERWEPHIQATYLLRPEAALAQARASEARWLRGEPKGALDGVPSTIKENIATEGDPTPLGTAAVELVPAAADAPCRPHARGRCRHRRQDHHARLRHAVLGPVHLHFRCRATPGM